MIKCEFEHLYHHRLLCCAEGKGAVGSDAGAVDDDEDDGHHSGAVIMVDTGVLNDGLPKWQSNVHDDVSSTQLEVHFSLGIGFE